MSPSATSSRFGPTATRPQDVAKREAEVERIASANVRLGQRIEETETPEFVERQARKLGLVKPGERLYIITGIDEWRQERQGRSEAGIR